MVQTRSATKTIESEKFHQNHEDRAANIVLGDGVPTPQAAKTSRRDVRDAAAAKKRRRGKPGEICRLNLDVLFLIAKYDIHPIDLLSLARTCKLLRWLLMDKSSAFVWKTTFRNVKGLPPCPVELTEPEYANLIYYARCHGCGKYTTTILWKVRRRYCPGCRIRWLRRLSSCNAIIRANNVLAAECITLKKAAESSMRVDREQAASFTAEYNSSPDKKKFLIEKRKQCRTILKHARECEIWQKQRDIESKKNKDEQIRKRCQSIFQHLDQHGYRREIHHFGHARIQRIRESDFRSSKPLTDKEWQKILPEWVTIMNSFRSKRLEYQVFGPRRQELVFSYNSFVRNPSADPPTSVLLPHVADLARFLPFADIINSPEEIRVNQSSFISAFKQLPGLLFEWKKHIDTELAELVKVPLRLCSGSASGSRNLAASSTSRAESPNADLDKLHLACALFQAAGAGVFTHIEVFSVSMLDRRYDKTDLERLGCISDRFNIKFLEEAPYIVHACGLDPNEATMDDMNRRNARLKCLACKGSTLVMDWKHAMWHAYASHQGSRTLPRLSKLPRWQLLGDEYTDAIQAVEQPIKGNTFPSSVRCLLCRPHVGDVIKNTFEFVYHLDSCHRLRREWHDVKEGEHYAPVGTFNSHVAVEMVEEGGHVTFRVPPI